jgi:hypothetical protein
MALNKQGFQVLELPPADPDIYTSFDDLGFDKYIPSPNRYRRFAQYRLTFTDGAWQFERLPHRAYVTLTKFNPVAGGIKREYEPIKVDFTEHIQAAVEAIPLDRDEDWQINVHQYRVVTTKDLQGVVVPEGRHQDGHEFVLIAVYGRHQITGAEMYLLPFGGEGDPFFTYTLQEGEAVVFDDRRMFHDVSDIVPVGDSGHRDILVTSFSRWRERWYGDEFDRQALKY